MRKVGVVVHGTFIDICDNRLTGEIPVRVEAGATRQEILDAALAAAASLGAVRWAGVPRIDSGWANTPAEEK